MKFSLQATRHAKVSGIAFAVALLLWTADYWYTYVGPAAIAKADDGRFLIGGVFAFFITGPIIALIFLPAIFAGAISRRILDLPRWVELPTVLVCGWMFSSGLLIWFAKGFMPSSEVPTAAECLRLYGIYLALPLSIYWHLTRNWNQTGEQSTAPNRA